MAVVGSLTLLQGLSLAGTVLSAVGTLREGAAAKETAKFNARVAEQNAETVRQQTIAQTETQDRERRIRRGRAIARGGASGVGIESFGDVLASSAEQERLDLLTLESEGLLRQRDFETEAELQRSAGDNAFTNSVFGAGSTLLSAGS